MKFDAYALKARIAPAAITCLIPLLIFNHFCASEELKKLIGEILGLKLLSADLNYLSLFLGRIIAYYQQTFVSIIYVRR